MTTSTYTNPVLDADWSASDVVRVGEDSSLTASGFGRVPGLPLPHSRDLADRTPVGHAPHHLEPAATFAAPRHDRGVAPEDPEPVVVVPDRRSSAATPWRRVGALLGPSGLAPLGTGHTGAATRTHFRIAPL